MEFCRVLNDDGQREAFFAYATQHRKSTLPSFLKDLQLVKLAVVEALRDSLRMGDAAAAAYAGLGQSPCAQATTKAHCLPALSIPITSGVFESARNVLPLGAVDGNTCIPQGARPVVAQFVGTYLGRGSSASAGMPAAVLEEVHTAMGRSSISLSTLDRAKDEVLFQLCTDTYLRYHEQLDAEARRQQSRK